MKRVFGCLLFLASTGGHAADIDLSFLATGANASGEPTFSWLNSSSEEKPSEVKNSPCFINGEKSMGSLFSDNGVREELFRLQKEMQLQLGQPLQFELRGNIDRVEQPTTKQRYTRRLLFKLNFEKSVELSKKEETLRLDLTNILRRSFDRETRKVDETRPENCGFQNADIKKTLKMAFDALMQAKEDRTATLLVPEEATPAGAKH